MTVPLESAIPPPRPSKVIRLGDAICDNNKRSIMKNEYVDSGILSEAKWKKEKRR